MSHPKLRLPPVPENEQTPRVQELLRLLMEQQKRIADPEADSKRAKGHPRKPKPTQGAIGQAYCAASGSTCEHCLVGGVSFEAPLFHPTFRYDERGNERRRDG